MVESWPPPALVVPEPDLLLHIKVIALNSPAHFHEIDQLAEWHLFIYGGEPILGRLSFALGPFNQQRFFGPACSAPDRCRAYPLRLPRQAPDADAFAQLTARGHA